MFNLATQPFGPTKGEYYRLSDKAIGRRFGVEYSNIRFWRAFYLEYGIEGLKKKVCTS
jgi:hypothetical protein